MPTKASRTNGPKNPPNDKQDAKVEKGQSWTNWSFIGDN